MGEVGAIEREASASPGTPDAVTSSPGSCTMIWEPGLHPSARFWSVTSIGAPEALVGSDAEESASRRPVGVLGSRTVKWSFGNGSMHCGAIGSQRVWVAVSTPSCATGTGRADHRGPRNHPHPLATNATTTAIAAYPRSRALPARTMSAPRLDDRMLIPRQFA